MNYENTFEQKFDKAVETAEKTVRLTFEFNNPDFQYQSGRLDILNLTILPIQNKDVPFEMDYEKVALYFNDERYDGNLATFFTNHLSEYELLENIVNHYLRDDKLMSFGEEWDKAFGQVRESLTKNKDGLITRLPQLDGEEVNLMHLDFATEGFRFYSKDDTYLLLDENNEIITNLDFFYEQAIIEEIALTLTGKKECLYQDESIDDWIKEVGEDYFTDSLEEKEQER